MPSLTEVLDLVREQTGLSASAIEGLEQEIRRTWPGERVYLAPANSRKDPRRAEQIRQASRKLPVGIVAQRYQVSRSYVYQVLKKKRP